MAIVVSENGKTVGRALQFYKRQVSGSSPQTMMIDKDCKEHSAIRRAFPNARVLLCRWHVIKYLYQMISEKVRGATQLKQPLRQTTRGMAYARTEDDYEILYKESLTLLEDQDAEEPDAFGPYFERNWYALQFRRKWAQYLRRGCVALENDTNNHAEAMNGVVKRRTRRCFRLKEFISALLEISDEGVFNFKSFAIKATMYVPVDTAQPQTFFLRHNFIANTIR